LNQPVQIKPSHTQNRVNKHLSLLNPTPYFSSTFETSQEATSSLLSPPFDQFFGQIPTIHFLKLIEILWQHVCNICVVIKTLAYDWLN